MRDKDISELYHQSTATNLNNLEWKWNGNKIDKLMKYTTKNWWNEMWSKLKFKKKEKKFEKKFKKNFKKEV